MSLYSYILKLEHVIIIIHEIIMNDVAMCLKDKHCHTSKSKYLNKTNSNFHF